MSLAEEAVRRIDREELVELALAVCSIDSAGPREAPVAEYVYEWLRREGFKARKVGLLADRYNVIGTLPGSGGGFSLLFNSHMDTSNLSPWVFKNPDDEAYRTAWRDGDHLVGEGVVNDKGPMAAFLIAAKSVKATGVPLKGDLLLTAVAAETSHEPCDEPPGTFVQTKDLGARYLVTHGGVADYALVAEGTGFSLVAVESGMATYKVTWLSDRPVYYTPYLPERTTPEDSPNMIVRAALGVLALERWAVDYQRRYTFECAGGTVVPKAQVGGIRGGNSTNASNSPQICCAYIGTFTPPGLDPLVLRDEIGDALREAGVPASEIELYHFRRGYEAKNAERLVDAVLRAHVETFGTHPQPADVATSSMWRDVNIFNEVGIPSITYGPRSETYPRLRSLSIDSLYQAACVYARIIVDICNQDKPRRH